MRLWFRERLKFKVFSDNLVSDIAEAVKISLAFDQRFNEKPARDKVAQALEHLAEEIREDK